MGTSRPARRGVPLLLGLVGLGLGLAMTLSGSGLGDLGSTPPSPAPTTSSATGAARFGVPTPYAGGAQGRLVVNTTDPAASPNDGLEMNITAFASSVFVTDSSFQASVTEVIGGHDAVFGIFENWLLPPTAFFAVYSNATDANELLTYWPSLVLQPGEGYLFAITPLPASTVWQLTVNGQPFGGNATASEFDFGAANSGWGRGLFFSEIALYPDQVTTPLQVGVPLPFAVHRPSGWYLPDEGRTYFSGTGGPAWGVEGRVQHPTLAPGALVSGTSIPPVANGTVLWTGGPVPVGLAVALDRGTALGISPVGVAIHVTDTSGSPLPGVAVQFNDSAGGSFVPATGLTDTRGNLSALLLTANVSANVSDLVRGRVTTFGYLGVAQASLALAPAVAVTILGPSTGVLTGNGSGGLTFTTLGPGGAPLAGIAVAFGLVGAGQILPAVGISDAAGHVAVTLQLPPGTPSTTVQARVTASGAWGQASFAVVFHAPVPPTFLQRYGVDLLAAAVLAALGAIAVALVARRRRRRKELPRMPIRRYWKEIRPPRPPGESPPTRTPP